MIHLDIIEMLDNKTDKKRTMLSINMMPGNLSETARDLRLEEIKQLCSPTNIGFEDAYAKLNEKFINEIIDYESIR